MTVFSFHTMKLMTTLGEVKLPYEPADYDHRFYLYTILVPPQNEYIAAAVIETVERVRKAG